MILINPVGAGIAWDLAPLEERLRHADLVIVGRIISESDDLQGELLPSKVGTVSVIETLKGQFDRAKLFLVYSDIVGGHYLGQEGIWILNWDERLGAYRCHEKADPEPFDARDHVKQILIHLGP
ncbi:MAG: hypothetical protein KF760_32730 [Candidatus Eremiobacteraeota bacterium]|nr:hypothetical protein [Candidatus Eremiobacteraeota bacterium]